MKQQENGRSCTLRSFINCRYYSPNIIRQIKARRMRWAAHVAHMGEERKVYKVLVGKPEGNTPLVRPRRKWEDRIRMYLWGIFWVCKERIQLA
jgi:hypothetical protein